MEQHRDKFSIDQFGRVKGIVDAVDFPDDSLALPGFFAVLKFA